MELVDCHAHTVLSGHGQGSVAQAVERACELGLSTFALTEHLWLPETLDPDHEDSMTRAQMGAYLDALVSQRARLAEQGCTTELVFGVEADWLSGRAGELAELVAPFEYVLGSVHYVEGLPIDYALDAGAWQAFGVDGAWRGYFEAWLDMAASGAPFSAFAHPDLPKKFGRYPSFDLREYYEQMAHAAADAGCMVEVNTSGLRKPVAELYPCLDLLREFRRADVECTVGSDAHSPAEIGADITRAYELLGKAGYTYLTVPTSEGGRRHVRLED